MAQPMHWLDSASAAPPTEFPAGRSQVSGQPVLESGLQTASEMEESR